MTAALFPICYIIYPRGFYLQPLTMASVFFSPDPRFPLLLESLAYVCARTRGTPVAVQIKMLIFISSPAHFVLFFLATAARIAIVPHSPGALFTTVRTAKLKTMLGESVSVRRELVVV